MLGVALCQEVLEPHEAFLQLTEDQRLLHAAKSVLICAGSR